MKLAVYGAGYVGLVSAVCFAKLGHLVHCVDVDQQRVDRLMQGDCPIFEKQLPELLQQQLGSGRLAFTTDFSQAIQFANLHIIATGTPSLANGHADLSQVFAVATAIAEQTNENCVLVIKSTVPVGTGSRIEQHIHRLIADRQKTIRILVASNPEFLREGSAVNDFLGADRVVIGGDEQALLSLNELYQPLVDQGVPLLSMSRQSAELTKYAANAMLACKISFINQISRIAEKTGANIDEIKQGITSDHRIGPHFLMPGIGYGGSCFPKDSRALIQVADELGVQTELLQAIETINHQQKQWVGEQLRGHFQATLPHRTIGIWGLAFKPGTDDLREASSLVIIDELLQAGASVCLYDPAAMDAAKHYLAHGDKVTWCSSANDVLNSHIDALVIATEWPEFTEYPLTLLQQSLGKKPLIDGRNCFSMTAVAQAGLSYYYSIGRPPYYRGE
ncbi:MAG: UDP-glucose dehydrogenase family protein [Legionella sp.]